MGCIGFRESVSYRIAAGLLKGTQPDGLPDYALEALDGVDLSFMLRVNPQAFAGVAPSVLAGRYTSLALNGITPYERKDWFQVEKVLKILRGK